jgi:hypothetical protein
MSTSHQIWQRARANCLGFKTQFQEQETGRRTYAKLNLDDLFQLLDSSVSSSARRGALEIRNLMCRRHWRITATAHRGGYGNGTGADQELHFNVLFPGIPPAGERDHYHLRCKERSDESLVIFEITNGKKGA